MSLTLRANTKAILLLTAPLILSRRASVGELLSLREYNALARHLKEREMQPADLIQPDASSLVQECGTIVDPERLQHLLERGFLLSQVLEHWQARAIWVMSRADPEYPARLKNLLKEDAPPILYGVGNHLALNAGGLAVVGSRNTDQEILDYAGTVGQKMAESRTNVVSGGARGVDQYAMFGALDAGGTVIGVLCNSLERAALQRQYRESLLSEHLVLVSTFDPRAGFTIGNAMQRNKYIYALADAALVVNADFRKGGTWHGAIEQLDKYKFVPVFVRTTGKVSNGLRELHKKGAHSFPELNGRLRLEQILRGRSDSAVEDRPSEVTLFDQAHGEPQDTSQAPNHKPTNMVEQNHQSLPVSVPESPDITAYTVERERVPVPEAPPGQDNLSGEQCDMTPATILFSAVRLAIEKLTPSVLNEQIVADALDVPKAQAKIWLERLAKEGLVEKRKRPHGYVLRQERIL